MSASNPPPPDVHDESEPDGWSDLSPDELAEIKQAFAEARENQRSGVPGIPVDEVLPRLRAREPLVLDPEDEEAHVSACAAIPDLDRRSELIPIEEYLAQSRAARPKQRRAG